MSVAEIADEMPGGFINGACAEYMKHKKLVDPSWLVGKGDFWPDDLKREALEWFVYRTLTAKTTSGVKFFNPSCRSGGRTALQRIRYTHNPDRPPMVRRTVYVPQSRLIPWSAEESDAQHAAWQATMSYRQLRDKAGAKPTAAQLRLLVDLADTSLETRHPIG